MLDSVTIKCSLSSVELRLSEPEGLRLKDGSEFFIATIKGDNLLASSRIYAFEPHSKLERFFEDVAANWRGWKGEKRWSSLEGEMRFICNSDGLGHVTIEVILDSYIGGNSGWSVRTSIHVDAGQLDQIALDVKRFFNM